MAEGKVEIEIKATGAKQAAREIANVQSTVSKSTGSIAKGVFKANVAFAALEAGVGLAVGALKTVVKTGIGVVKSSIEMAASYEQQRIALTTLLGSTNAADEALKRIKKDAKTTPFELPGLIDMNKRLIAAGLDADRAADNIITLGNAVSAVGGGQAEMDRLISNMQQIKSIGKASAMDIRQFGFAGIPIFDLLSESMGKTKEQISEMVTDGKVGFEELEAAFAMASKEGGRFFGAMDNQSKTFTGVMSNVSDSIGIMLTEFAQSSGIFDLAKKGAQGLKVKLEEMAESKGFKNFTEGVKTGLSDIIAKAKEFAKTKGADFIEKLREFAQKHGPKIEEVFNKFKKLVKDEIGPALDELKDAFKEAFGSEANRADIIGGLKIIAAIIGAIVVVAIKLVSWGIRLVALFIRLKTSTTEAFQSLSDKIKELPDKIRETWENMKMSANEFWISLKEKFRTGVDSIITFIKELPGNLLFAFGMMIAHVQNFVVTAPDKMRNAFFKMKEHAGNMVTSVIEFFRTLPGKIIIFINNLRDQIKAKSLSMADSFKNSFINAIKSIATWKDKIINWFKRDVPNGVSSGVKKIGDFFNSIPGKVKSALNSAIYWVEAGINKIVDGYNSAAKSLPGVNTISRVSIPRLHSGGEVPGISGREVPIIAQAGEVVMTKAQISGMLKMFKSMSSKTVNVNGNMSFGGNRPQMQQESIFLKLLQGV